MRARRDGTTATVPPAQPPVHDAVDRADLTTLRRLIAAGADLEVRDAWGQTPLFRAVGPYGGWRQGVEALLAAGADPNARLPDGTTLVQAALAGASSAIEASYARDLETLLRAHGYRDP